MKRPTVSFWITWALTALTTVVGVLSPWMFEWHWPLYFTGGKGDRGGTETIDVSVVEFPLYGGIFLASMAALLGLGVVARYVVDVPQSVGWTIAGVAVLIGMVAVAGAAQHIAQASVELSEAFWGNLTDREKLDILGGGAHAESAPGLDNALAAPLLGLVPVGIALHARGPVLLAAAGAALCLIAFAVPWESATAFSADQVERHDYWFTVYAERQSWLMLAGCLVLIATVAGALVSRGAVQALLALATPVYVVLLIIGTVWMDEYEHGQYTPIENDLADALYVEINAPAWPSPMGTLLGGAMFLMAAALWAWIGGIVARRRLRRQQDVSPLPASL